jgi:2Fe-2S ferredoxin
MAAINVTNRAGAKHKLDVPADSNLMEVLRNADMDILAICNGACSCSTCHVYIDGSWAGKLPAPSAEELEVLEETEHYQPTSRLSCQINVSAALDGLSVTIAPED